MKKQTPDVSSLINEGVFTLNTPGTGGSEKTVVVLGLARGGTTMVASVLQALGVPMGERLGAVFEDVVLSEAVEARDVNRLRDLVAQRNLQHPVWGWKRPAALDFSDVWRGVFRNPYFIAVFRDPFAIANRNRISMLSDLFDNMERSIQQLDKLVKFLRRQDSPILLCSYEKVLVSPETFVRAVDDFLDLNASQRWDAAVAQVNPGPKQYLETSRITQSVGHLDMANRQMCGGWAFFPKLPQRAARVQILVNDRLIETIAAEAMRADLRESGRHPSGRCGFKFKWPAHVVLKAGDQVQARVEGDTKPLVGSPKTIPD